MSSLRSYLMEITNEYGRVLSMYRALTNLNNACSSGEYEGVVKEALIESILVHSRNLVQFFKIVRGRRYKDVIYYLPYLRRGTAREFRKRVSACPGYGDAQGIIRSVNKYVAHLTKDFAESGGKVIMDVNSVIVIVKLLCCVFSVFADYVDSRIVGDDVFNALRSIVGDCVK